MRARTATSFSVAVISVGHALSARRVQSAGPIGLGIHPAPNAGPGCLAHRWRLGAEAVDAMARTPRWPIAPRTSTNLGIGSFPFGASGDHAGQNIRQLQAR